MKTRSWQLPLCAAGLMLSLCLLAACTPRIYLWPTGNTIDPSASAEVESPAALFCTQNGGRSVVLRTTGGNERGYCVFLDRSACEEWAYYRAQCEPGQNPDFL